MNTINLTPDELKDVTGRSKACAQVRWFRMNGFTVLVRADGRPLVSRAHFESKMGGITGGSKPLDYEPDLGAL